MQTKKNLHQSVMQIITAEKSKILQISKKDQRKNQNEDLIQAKNKYKCYL
jgi:hypothetical protein